MHGLTPQTQRQQLVVDLGNIENEQTLLVAEAPIEIGPVPIGPGSIKRRPIDIVIVPSSGRTSRETWTKEGRPACFWSEWLRESGRLRMARVWTTAEDYAANSNLNLLDRPAETIDSVISRGFPG